MKCTLKVGLQRGMFAAFQGMAYLHKSALGYHGHLSSNVCLVDSRWTLKVSGYDINILGSMNKLPTAQLWTAPEVLRNIDLRSLDAHQQADVFSFGIVMQEILYMAEPFFIDEIDKSYEGAVNVRALTLPTLYLK